MPLSRVGRASFVVRVQGVVLMPYTLLQISDMYGLPCTAVAALCALPSELAAQTPAGSSADYPPALQPRAIKVLNQKIPLLTFWFTSFSLLDSLLQPLIHTSYPLSCRRPAAVVILSKIVCASHSFRLRPSPTLGVWLLRKHRCFHTDHRLCVRLWFGCPLFGNVLAVCEVRVRAGV